MGPPLGAALEFISQVLSQRGPQAVPYDERHKWTIREHLSELLKMFPNVTVKVSEFHSNDGRILHLVKAEGTIPIHYQAHKYNIPVVVWLPERYPLQPPIAYVNPTPDMIIKSNHSCVDPSGLVRTPCIANWLHPCSDLSSTCQEMAMLFGGEPPLYTKPAGYVPPQSSPGRGPSSNPYAGFSQQPHQQQQQQPLPQQHLQQHPQHAGYAQQPRPQQAAGAAGGSGVDPMLGGHSIWGAAYAAAHSQQQQQQQGGSSVRPPPPPAAGSSHGLAAAAGTTSSGMGYGSAAPVPPPPDPKQQQVDELTNSFKGLAARALNGRLQAGLEAYNRFAAEEMDQLLEVQRQLGAREQQLQALVSSIQQERLGTEGLVGQLGRQAAALESWLSSHEWKADAVAAADSSAAGLDVNKVVVPADDLSRQALAAQAEDLAVEDCLLVLEKALLEGRLAPDVYMKQVRLLCRRQFLARALGLKVAQAQRSMPQQGPRSGGSSSSSSAAPAAACTLTHGDTWSHGYR